MKTVLAKGAPWPVWGEDGKPVKPPPKPKPKKIPPPKNPSKIARTDKNFDEWADKNLARKFK